MRKTRATRNATPLPESPAHTSETLRAKSGESIAEPPPSDNNSNGPKPRHECGSVSPRPSGEKEEWSGASARIDTASDAEGISPIPTPNKRIADAARENKGEEPKAARTALCVICSQPCSSSGIDPHYRSGGKLYRCGKDPGRWRFGHPYFD